MGLAVTTEAHTGTLVAPATEPGIVAVPGSRRDLASADSLSAHMALVSPRRHRRPVSRIMGLHEAVGAGQDDPIPTLDATRPVSTA